MPRPRLPALLALAALAAACRPPLSASSPASGLTALRARVARVELCRTTEKELREGFGPPLRDGRLGAARVLSWRLAGGDVERILAVLLDRRGVVVDLYFDVPGVVDWAPRDLCAGRQDGETGAGGP